MAPSGPHSLTSGPVAFGTNFPFTGAPPKALPALEMPPLTELNLEWLEWDRLEWDRLEWDRRNVPFQISRCRKAKVNVPSVPLGPVPLGPPLGPRNSFRYTARSSSRCRMNCRALPRWVRWWGTLAATTRRSPVMHATIAESWRLGHDTAAEFVQQAWQH